MESYLLYQLLKVLQTKTHNCPGKVCAVSITVPVYFDHLGSLWTVTTPNRETSRYARLGDYHHPYSWHGVAVGSVAENALLYDDTEPNEQTFAFRKVSPTTNQPEPTQGLNWLRKASHDKSKFNRAFSMNLWVGCPGIISKWYEFLLLRCCVVSRSLVSWRSRDVVHTWGDWGERATSSYFKACNVIHNAIKSWRLWEELNGFQMFVGN